jgi:hypothetical protein
MSPARTTTTRTSPARFDGDATTQYAVIVWKGGHMENVQKFYFSDPVETLATAVEYLKSGYQVRLSDRTVAHFAELSNDANPVGPVTPKFSGGPALCTRC